MIQFYKNKKEPHFLFDKEYKYTFCNEPIFYLFWEISDNFEESAKSFGIPNLKTIVNMMDTSEIKLSTPLRKIYL